MARTRANLTSDQIDKAVRTLIDSLVDDDPARSTLSSRIKQLLQDWITGALDGDSGPIPTSNIGPEESERWADIPTRRDKP